MLTSLVPLILALALAAPPDPPPVVQLRVAAEPITQASVQNTACEALRDCVIAAPAAPAAPDAGAATAPADSPVTVTIMDINWDLPALQAVAKAYSDTHPGVTVTAVWKGDPMRTFRDAKMDLVAFVGTFWVFGQEEKDAAKEVWGEKVPGVTVAWRPLVAVVHPKNPMGQISIDHLRFVAQSELTAWKQIGLDRPGYLVKHLTSPLDISQALFDGQPAKRIPAEKFNPAGVPKAPALKPDEVRKYIVRDHMERTIIELLSANEDGLGLLPLTPAVQGSGLKILILTSPRTSAKPTMAEVSTGVYTARVPHLVALHPEAGPAAKEFAKWLTGPEAAAAMAPWCLANAVSKDLPAQPKVKPPEDAAGGPPPFSGKVDGAVAVLPCQSDTAVFFLAEAGHRAAYEDAIADALARDGRLKVVDRQAILRVIAEREAALTGTGAAPPPVIAADVLIVPHVVTQGAGSYLRLRALYAPTASTLATLHVPIDAADLMSFKPPLGEQVARWWPRVLGRLVQARTRPVWSLLDADPAGDGDATVADEAAEALRRSLRQEPGAFFAEYDTFSVAQQEVLMSFMGISASGGPRFTPAADYLLDVRLASPTDLRLSVLGGPKLEAAASTTITGATPEKARDKAAEWARSQAATLKPAAGTPATSADAITLAAGQARLEMARRDALFTRREALQARYHNPEGGPLRAFSAADGLLADHLVRRIGAHLARAVQLDPNSERAARERVRFCAISGGNEFYALIEATILGNRFVQGFPKSPEHRGMTEYVLNLQSRLCAFLKRPFAPPEFPAGLDRAQLLLAARGQQVELHRIYCEAYLADFRKGRRGGSTWIAYDMLADHYLYHLSRHLVAANASPADIEREIDAWATRFGDASDAAPHSDFLRLKVLGLKRDKAGWISQLTAMQQRHPDPKDAYWQRCDKMVIAVETDLRDLFRGSPDRSGNNSFARWKKGERGIGDLPWPGYVAEPEGSGPK